MALSFMRQHAKSKFIKILLGGVALSFLIGFGAFAYVSDTFRNKQPGDDGGATWVAKVNGVPIDAATMAQTMRFLEDRYRQMLGDNADMMLKQLDLPTLALNELINERVVEQVADQMGLVVTDTELADSIYRMGAFSVNGHFDRQRYVSTLRRYKMTPTDFEEEHRRELLAQKLRYLVRSTIKVSDGELREEFLNREDKVSLKYVKLLPKEVESELSFSDEQVQSFFEKNKEQFKVPEKRKVNYMMLSPDDYIGEVEVTQAEIENFYNENADRFKHEEEVKARHILISANEEADPVVKQAAKLKADGILKQLRDGADFAELAAANSEDPGSKTRGGDLGWFPRGRMVPQFDEAAFSLKPNEISEVIETRFGYHIIQVLERHDAGVTPFEEKKEEIEQILERQKAMDKAKAKADELYAMLKPEDDLLTFGSEQGRKVGSSSTFAKNTPVPGIGAGMQASRLAFMMQKDEISEPFSDQSAVYIMQLTTIVEEHLPELAEVQQQVRDALQKDTLQEALKTKANEIIGLIKSGKTLEEAAASYGLEVQTTGLFARNASSVPKIGMAPELLAAAFGLNDQNTLLPTPYESGNGIVVCMLDQRQQPSDDDFIAKKDDIKDEMIEQKASVTLQSWIEQAQKTMKVERNEAILQALQARAGRGNNS